MTNPKPTATAASLRTAARKPDAEAGEETVRSKHADRDLYAAAIGCVRTARHRGREVGAEGVSPEPRPLPGDQRSYPASATAASASAARPLPSRQVPDPTPSPGLASLTFAATTGSS